MLLNDLTYEVIFPFFPVVFFRGTHVNELHTHNVRSGFNVLDPSSNCVVNLSPDKRRVLEEAYRVLKVHSGDAIK